MKVIAIAITLFMGILPVPASAGFLSGSQLFGYLDQNIKESSDFNAGVGSGYVIGVADSLENIVYCPPFQDQKISVRQIDQIVYNYMQQHPETWGLSANLIVGKALQNVWPCTKR